MLRALIATLVDIYTWIIIIYVLMSWIPQKKGILADIDSVLEKLCEPVLQPIRKLIPPIGGMVDISPVIAVVVLQLVARLIIFIL